MDALLWWTGAIIWSVSLSWLAVHGLFWLTNKALILIRWKQVYSVWRIGFLVYTGDWLPNGFEMKDGSQWMYLYSHIYWRTYP